MRIHPAIALLPLLVACSGDDDPPGTTGGGVGTGAASGAAGSGSLGVGGRSGSSGGGQAGGGGKSGSDGQAGAAGQSGNGGAGGQAGSAGTGGQAGIAGSAGTAPMLQPSTSVCGNDKLEPGERCDGTQGIANDISCADLLGDPLASGSATCDRCFPSATGCVSCHDGRKNGIETDIDCGGGAADCGACTLGLACKTDPDCATGLVCVAGVCNAVTIDKTNGVSQLAPGVGRAVGIIVRSVLPIPADTPVSLSAHPSAVLEGNPPYDLTRLVVRVPTGGSGKGTLTIGGHAFDLDITAPVPASKGSTVVVNTVVGRVGKCTEAGAPLALETKATGPSPALELPIGATVCLHAELSGNTEIPWNAALGGTVLFSGSLPPRTFMDLEYPISKATALHDAVPANTVVDLAIRFGTGVTSSHLVGQRIVFTPLTLQVGATGVGTTSNPAGTVLDSAMLAGTYPAGSVVQLSGKHLIPAGGLVVPANLTLVGIDADASIVAAFPGTSITLANGAALRDLAIVGTPDGNAPSGDCVRVQGATTMRHVSMRRCLAGVRLQMGASLTMVGRGTDDITDVTDAIVGEEGASVVGVGLGLVGDATGTAVKGFSSGAVTLVRPKVNNFDSGVSLDAGAKGRMVEPTIEVRRRAALATGSASLLVEGGSLTLAVTTGALPSTGVTTTQGATADLRGVTIRGALEAGVLAEGGSIALTSSVLTQCGSAERSSAVVAAGGSLTAHALRIEQPVEAGVRVLPGATALTLTGTVVDGAKVQALSVAGGLTKLRTVQLLDPAGKGLVYGDPALVLEARDLDIVRHAPSSSPDALIVADRHGSVKGDVLGLRTLVAGAGKVVSSVAGAPVCTKQLVDPLGGTYLEVAPGGADVCF